MTIIESSAAAVFALDGITFTALAAPSRGSRENSAWRVRVAPGTLAGGTHRVTREEIFIALSGSADVMLAGRKLSLQAGSALVVPRDTDFSLGNSGTEAFEAVAVLPVGGQAVLPDGAAFVPPWAQ
jgi:mannose-6-phosphate isomerase-like protein (cupin superfamily)